jgi:hypothetical protein
MFKIVKNIDYFMLCYGAYISFACYWFGMGMLVIVLIAQIFYHDVMTKTDYWFDAWLIFAWSFSLLFSHRFADLRFVRKHNAESREIFKLAEKSIDELENDEGFKEWLKNQKKPK